MYKPSTQTSSHQLTNETLIQENMQFSGTTAVSANNRDLRFLPAFMDTETGNIHLSCFPNGMPAPIHLLTGLPESLIETHEKSGSSLSIKSSVISGFVRDNTFYSREEAAQIAA